MITLGRVVRLRVQTGNPGASPQESKPALQFLNEGARGYAFTPGSDEVIEIGDALVMEA